MTHREPLRSVSPSRLVDLLACPRRVALARSNAKEKGSTTAPSDAAALGIVAHDALERLVTSSLDPDEFKGALDRHWNDSLTAFKRDYGYLPGGESPRRRMLKRLRDRVVPELAELIRRVGAPVAARTEHQMSSREGKLYGEADLIIDGHTEKIIVDYKSGLVRDTELPKAAYRDQLAFYAGLDAECSGRWATTVALLSLREGLVEWQVDRAASEALLDQAVHALDQFNAHLESTEPAFPSESNCRWCDVSELCPPFWGAADASWTAAGFSQCVAGPIVAAPELADNGLIAVELDAERGTAQQTTVLVTCLESLPEVHIGDRLGVVNLRGLASDEVLEASPRTRVALL